ncbi:zinc transporter 5-like isoform X2 [Silene latifolia]|uniref:zinc transporter 5-like isoform X2 n=1 Tax=Silene latifolia TaxID=37657 RepID=UPI003D77A6A0
MVKITSSKYLIFTILIIILIHITPLVVGECTCDQEDIDSHIDKGAIKYKVGALFAILVASGIGVTIPILGKHIPALHPDKSLFFLIKSFAAGVILSTGFIHILPDAFESLSNPCLKDNPWANFPFTGLAAMVGAIGTLMIDALATSHYRKVHTSGVHGVAIDEEKFDGGHVHLATHGHSHGGPSSATAIVEPEGLSELDRLRYKVTSQVLEMGIVVHSVIIGISLGTSQSIDTIKPLMAALCFHQFFEGMGLGGCIAQASFKSASTLCMAMFFSLTTPVGIAIGIGITNVYNENSPTALIVQGLLDAVAAGILIYMALVDLLAQDFMNPKVQSNKRLFLGANIALLLGAGFMALLAIWA